MKSPTDFRLDPMPLKLGISKENGDLNGVAFAIRVWPRRIFAGVLSLLRGFLQI